MIARRPYARLATLLALAATVFTAPSAAAQAEPARVMILGTYHFANPGLDVVKTEVADVLSPARQAEIREVVEAIARFRPTRIAVERVPARAAELDSLYAAFRAGRHEPSRDETEQLGFRLAARFEHARVHPIDHRGEFPFQALMEYAARNDTAFVGEVQAKLAEVAAEENRLQREATVGEHLRLKNDPRRLARDHAMYVRFARVGAGDGYVGADLLSKWYDRNIRMFANVQRVAGPGERVVVIVGSGHAPILRELVSYDAGMELVEAVDYLPPAPGAR